jgi:transposase
MSDFENVSVERRAKIVAESSLPGAVIAEVARRYGVSPNMLYGWRSESREASAPKNSAIEFVELDVSEPENPPPESRSASKISKVLVEFGACHLSLEGSISVAAVSQILTILEESC